MDAARAASQEHPARVLGVILGDARGAGVVNAQVGTGSGWTGETALIRLKGEVVKHAESVVLPLLLPGLTRRRLVARRRARGPCLGRARAPWRSAGSPTPPRRPRTKTKAIHTQCTTYAKGNTDLAWTRITPWRALLAAALDQHPEKVRSASVTAERISPSADLLVAWLSDRLHVDVERHNSDGPGITDVVLSTRAGDISDQPPRRQARGVLLPRPAGPAGRAEATRALRAAGRGAAAARRGRHLRRGGASAW